MRRLTNEKKVNPETSQKLEKQVTENKESAI